MHSLNFHFVTILLPYNLVLLLKGSSTKVDQSPAVTTDKVGYQNYNMFMVIWLNYSSSK